MVNERTINRTTRIIETPGETRTFVIPQTPTPGDRPQPVPMTTPEPDPASEPAPSE
jgi:hypothetical protein